MTAYSAWETTMIKRSAALMFRVLALLLPAGWAAAGPGGFEVPLPADTQQFVVLNVKQILASEVNTKYLLDGFKKSLAAPDAKEFLRKTGIDPLRDIKYVVF